MPLFGAHMSIAGGHRNALNAALEHGCECVQLFTKSSNQWKAKELVDAEVAEFKQALRDSGFGASLAHDSYLINLASPDDTLYRKSIEAFVIEVQRAETLGLDYLVMHPGASLDSGEAVGLKRVAQALDDVEQRCRGYHLQVLLETTAGQGSSLGHRFEHLAEILAQVAQPEWLGVCFDTCHVFAAGYPLAPAADYQATMQAFDAIVGLEHLKAFHVNDSMKPQGSRVDRHAHIGRGCLGLEPFRLLVNDPRFAKHPMILETPKEDGEKVDMDSANLKVLRNLVAAKPRAALRKKKE